MQCDEARPLLEVYVDAELPAVERAALREHLADCAQCGPEAAALERLRDEIRRAAPAYRAPAALRAQIGADLRREASGGARGGIGWLAYAASLLVAVALGSG